MQRLKLLSLVRQIRENLLFWGFLFWIYSLVAALVVQPFAEYWLKHDVSLWWCAAIVNGIFLLSFFIGKISLPMPSPVLRKTSLIALPAINHLRNPITLIVVLISFGMLNVFFKDPGLPAFMVALMLPLQVAFVRTRSWRRFFLEVAGRNASPLYLYAVAVNLLVVAVLSWAAHGLFAQSFSLALLLTSLSVALGCAMVALEGDSGTVGIVNLISIASGLFCGAFTSEWPWLFLIFGFLFIRFVQFSVDRVRAVEEIFEDVTI